MLLHIQGGKEDKKMDIKWFIKMWPHIVDRTSIVINRCGYTYRAVRHLFHTLRKWNQREVKLKTGYMSSSVTF